MSWYGLLKHLKHVQLPLHCNLYFSHFFSCPKKINLFSNYRDASIQRLSDLQISDCRYKHRPNCPTTVMDQFLRGRGLQSAIFIMASDEEADFTIPFWKNTLLSLSKIVGKLT